jgi:hypothetical protein
MLEQEDIARKMLTIIAVIIIIKILYAISALGYQLLQVLYRIYIKMTNTPQSCHLITPHNLPIFKVIQ